MDFFQRLGNFFTGKGWINDDEKRRKEQQPQPVQQQPVQQSTVQQPAWIRQNAQTPTISQPPTPKVNLNPLQQANQATQQLNLNSQNNQLKPQVTANDAPKVLTPQGQQDWANQQNKQIQAHNMAVQPPKPQQVQQPVQQPQQPQKPQPYFVYQNQNGNQTLNDIANQNKVPTLAQQVQRTTPLLQQKVERINAPISLKENEKANFFDYLNPFGRHGLFGPKNQQDFQRAVKPVNDVLSGYEKWVDSSDNKEGFQWNDPMDYARFVAKLPSGMASGLINAPSKIGAAMGGYRVKDDGNVEKLSDEQRTATLLDGTIDVGGLAFGGSGTLLKSLGKQSAKQAILNTVKEIAKDSAKEGLEESTQTFLGDVADNGRLDAGIKDYGQSFALGALGGGVMSGAGKGVQAGKSALNNTIDRAVRNINSVQANADMPSTTTNGGANTITARQNDAGWLEQENSVRRPVQQQPQIQTQTATSAEINPVNSRQAGYSSFFRRPVENTSIRQAAEVNAVNTRTNQAHPIQQVSASQTVETTMPNASPALKQAVSQNISNIQRGDTNAIATRQQTTGKLENYLIEQATQNVQNTMAQDVRYKMVRNGTNLYHGSPHEFSKFSTDNIGSGEGNQSFGWGLYFTDNKGIGEHYADIGNTNNRARMKNDLISGEFRDSLYVNKDVMSDELQRFLSENGYNITSDMNPNELARQVDSLRQQSQYYGKKADEMAGTGFDSDFIAASEKYNNLASELEQIVRNSSEKRRIAEEEINQRVNDIGHSRNLYNVDLASSDGRDFDFLSWYDAVDPEQKHKIKQQALVENLTDKWGTSVRDTENYPNSIPFDADESGASIYHKLQSEWAMTPKETSMFLSRAGIDGIIYPADSLFNANNRDLGKAESTNYVVFDENNVKVRDYVRFKRQEAHIQELVSSVQKESDLIARHLDLTGDERLVFNEWQNEMQRKALGYYNPKTDTINLNQLTEDTLNHELGHKLLERANNKQELLTAIRRFYGDNYLINKYGQQYGTTDINLLAEEQLADGFSEYYNGKLNGENTQRLAARLHIPQRIVAIYDRITEAIRGLISKQDIIKQFYAQMETGKFRNAKQQVPGGDGRVRTMSIDPERALHAIKGIDDLANSRRALFTLARVSDNLANRIKTETGISISKDARIVMDRSGAVHMLSTHGQGGKKPANPLTDADLGRLPYVLEDPDVIIKGKPVRNTERIRMERNLEGNKIAIVEVIKKGNELRVVTYFNDSSSGRTNPAYNMSKLDDTSETGQLQSTNLNGSIPKNTQNVNTGNRYQHPLQETINNIQDNPKPKMTKELRQAIDEEIYNYYPELFVSEAADLQSTNGDWNIPRLHVDDLRHYLGELANDIPSRYKRRDGKRDIDTVAQEMGYDDIDSFINEIHRVLEARRNVRAGKQRLAELRRDPDIIADAQQALAAKNSNNPQTAQSQQSPDEQLKETVQNQPLEQQGFKNIPLEDNHLLTKGNLYEQTKPGIRDDWTRPFQDGDYEYRLHTKRSRDGKKSFNSFERRYVGDNGEYGDWMPTSRAAYIWKSQTKDIGKVNRNEAIQKALEAAEQDGEVQEFMAYRNPVREGGIAVVPLVGEHSIDGGFVRNPKTGEIEGNYIQVTPFGVVHQTNGKFDVVEADRLTNALGKSRGSIFDNFNRLIEKNIHDVEGQKVLKDLYYQKTEAYAKYADALKSLFAKHNAVADLLDKSRGKFTSSKRFWEDVGRYTEGIFPTSGPNETINEAFARKYGTQAAERVKTYDAFMRENYDAMIKNLNAIRRMYGKEEIPYLENYMPHIQKRSGLLGRAADRLLSAVPTGIRGDIEGQSRGEIPASIAGLSADFKPGHKFNPNEKHRHGGMMDYEKDPRKAFEHYADLMLYNTHMEPVIARGRQIESSMRATDMAKKSGTFIDPDSNLAQGDTVSNKATIAVQDFVNEMAGKSSSLDRPFIDRANKHIQFIQRLESVNGANKILGNLSSTLAQTLNLPETVRDNGVINTGHAFLTAFDKTTKQAMSKSPFLRERYTDTDGKFTRSGYQRVTDKISVVSGMNLVEKKFIQLNWAANYYRFQKQGLTGYQLIKAADQATERAVGGRGIGAMPQAYKSTLGKMFLQFTYETNESWKNNISHVKKIGSDIKQLQFKDAGSGAVRAAEAFAVAYGMNMLMKQVTGDEPLANMVDAVKDVLSNDADDDGEDDKLGQKIARIGSEASKMNPVASAAFNLVPKSEREKIFGKSSDLGRFDGATGVAQTAANALGAGFYAAQGDSENAQKNLQGLIPAGGQLKKTMGGAKVLQEGGDVYIDKNGKERTNFEVDSGNAWNQAKALLFGKNAVRPDEKSAVASSSNGDASRTVRDFERGLKKGTYKVQDDLVVNKKGDVQRSYYKALAESQGESDEAYSNWMKAYNIDDASTLKKEFNSSNDILNKLENGEKKANKAKSAVDILMGKHKDLPDWVKERYYKESGYSKEQIEYGAMTTHKEVSLMDNYWRQKAQESSHEELMQALTNGRRKSITGQMFAKNGVINKLRAEGYITKWEAKALNAAQFDVDGNRITKEMSGGGNGRSGSGRSSGGRASSSPLISATVKNINSLTSAAPKANQTSVKGININQIGQNLINRSATQRQVNATLKQWNSTSKKNPKIHIKKARA
jgi:putative mediator of RNA polymerase II transcription subunit 12